MEYIYNWRLGSRAGSSQLASLHRAEPDGRARQTTEPSLARLATVPSPTEPSRAWLGSARFQPYMRMRHTSKCTKVFNRGLKPYHAS
jgi:hypothetical protein